MLSRNGSFGKPSFFVVIVLSVIVCSADRANDKPAATPKPATIVGSSGSYYQNPPSVTLVKSAGDQIEWTNSTADDVRVCVSEKNEGHGHRAFQRNGFLVRGNGGTARSGGVRTQAVGGGHGYDVNFYKATSLDPFDHCPPEPANVEVKGAKPQVITPPPPPPGPKPIVVQ